MQMDKGSWVGYDKGHGRVGKGKGKGRVEWNWGRVSRVKGRGE